MVVAERAQHRREAKDKNPSRPGRAPGQDDAHNNDDCRNAERDGRHRGARCDPNADEPGQREWDEGHSHSFERLRNSPACRDTACLGSGRDFRHAGRAIQRDNQVIERIAPQNEFGLLWGSHDTQTVHQACPHTQADQVNVHQLA